MFPNIRLTIVALLASVVGIGCGLALFAAFRVNREPFAHLSNGGRAAATRLRRACARDGG